MPRSQLLSHSLVPNVLLTISTQMNQSSINNKNTSCLVCGQELGNKNTSRHHLVPRSKGGKNSETIRIHNICHDKIHSVFTEKELKVTFSSVEKIKENEVMIKFIKWVSNKKIDFYQSSKRLKRR